MGGYILAVSTRPVRGAEREYHEWYQDFHLDEVLEIPGFISAERLEVLSSEDSALDAGTGTYFALFRVESDDIAVTVNTFREAQKVMAVPSCLDPESVSVQWWRSVGKRSPSANDTQDSAH